MQYRRSPDLSSVTRHILVLGVLIGLSRQDCQSCILCLMQSVTQSVIQSVIQLECMRTLRAYLVMICVGDAGRILLKISAGVSSYKQAEEERLRRRFQIGAVKAFC